MENTTDTEHFPHFTDTPIGRIAVEIDAELIQQGIRSGAITERPYCAALDGDLPEPDENGCYRMSDLERQEGDHEGDSDDE